MRKLFQFFALAVLAAAAGVAVLGVQAPWSPSGWFALGTLSVAAVALAIRDPRPRRGLSMVALLLLLVFLGVRLARSGGGMISMRTLPAGSPSRWLARLLDEQDLALVAARVRTWRSNLPASEREGLFPALGKAYADMRLDEAFSPSPVLDTLAGRQSPAATDTLIIEPRPTPKPGVVVKLGVIFLHGYAGSTTLGCWLVASAARGIGAVTVCPATDFSGRWQNEAGERIVSTSLDYLHARGIKRVFLAGFSNGADGASALASRFSTSLEGLILISGAPASGGNAGLPTLVVHGLQDSLTSVAAARAFVARTGAAFAWFEGGHFVLLLRRGETREAITNWLMAQAGYRVQR